MVRRMFSPFAAPAVRVAVLVGLICLGTGCSGEDTMKNEPAAQAWKDVASNKKTSNIFAIFLPRDVGSAVKGSYAEDAAEAEKNADLAMKSDLPGVAVDAMVDDIAAYFAEKLPQLPEVKAAKSQLVLAFGNLGDTEGNAQTTKALKSLRGKLFKNAAMTNDFVFVETSESDAKALSAKLAGGDTSAFRDPLQRSADNTKPVVYDPASMYLITGQLSSEKQAATHEVIITMTFDFTPVLARTVEVSQDFTRTYMWHPIREEWELQK